MILAIDPGKSGGFAWRYDGEVHVRPMPNTEADCVQHLQCLTAVTAHKDRVCYIEKVNGYCGNSRGTGSSMFTFGHGRGVLIGALMAFGWRIIQPTPQQWQKWLEIGKVGGDKNKLKAEAQRRFPTVDGITLKTADALLILDYAEHKEGSK